MKIVLVSQRQDRDSARGEMRDSLDSRLSVFLTEVGYTAIALPNNPRSVADLCNTLRPAAIVLSGGNTVGELLSRDETEAALLRFARDENTPVLGICRGMQMMNHFLGGSLKKIDSHVARTHTIRFAGSSPPARAVNSYHNLAIDQLADGFNVEATSEDGVIEAIKHSSLPWFGIMWHPERELPFHDEDVALVARVLKTPKARTGQSQ